MPSSLQLIAGAGILGNVGGVAILANTSVVSAIGNYYAVPAIAQYSNVVVTGNAVLANTVVSSLLTLGNTSFPAVTDTTPNSFSNSIGPLSLSGFAGVITGQIDNIMGNGDLGKFDQIISAASGYCEQINGLINSSINANTLPANQTFQSQDSIITGGLSQLTQAFGAFGNDLGRLGLVLDLDNLPNIGSPAALLNRLTTLSTLPASVYTVLLAAGVSSSTLGDLPDASMTDAEQKLAYEGMTKVTGATLAQVLSIFRVTTAGITTMADLLNPVKLFPSSFNTLTAPTSNGLRAIYIDSTGAVNSNLLTILPPSVLSPLLGNQTSQSTYAQLKKIIPEDQALANKALQAGLEQVKAVFNVSLPDLGAAARRLESTKGLNLVTNIGTVLPSSVTDFYRQTLGTGTGNSGRILLSDVIGSAAGWVITGNIATTTTTLTSLTDSGALSSLTNSANGVYTVMQNTINGQYTTEFGVDIPVGLPGAGNYADIDTAFTNGLIPAANVLITNIVSNNSTDVANTTSAFGNCAQQIILENTNLLAAGIGFGNLIAGTQATGLVDSLPSYGLDTSEGGAAWFLEATANLNSQGGQAVVGTMREARNQESLQAVGIQTSIEVSNQSPQPQAPLSSGQYTAAEASSQKII